MDKKKILKMAIIFVIIVALVALIVFAINWFKNAPIRLVKNYITATEEGNIDKLENMFDFKGWYAWNESDENVDDFYDLYKDTNDDDAIAEIKNWGYEDTNDYLKSIMYGDDNVSYKISKEPTINKLGKNLYEVKAKIKVDDDGYEFTETWKFTIYNNKIIYMTDID